MTSIFTAKVIPQYLRSISRATSNVHLKPIPRPQRNPRSTRAYTEYTGAYIFEKKGAIMSPLRSALSTASRSLLSIRQFALTSFRQNNHASTSPFTQLRNFSALMSQSRWGGLLLRSKIAGGIKNGSKSTYVLSQVSGMKTRSSVKRLCDGCKVSFS